MISSSFCRPSLILLAAGLAVFSLVTLPTTVAKAQSAPSLPPTKSVVSDGQGYCALLTSGGVDCWGNGYYGELGNGKFYASGNEGSAVPVAVVSTSGSGTLSGVTSLTSDGWADCALLATGKVDCWGYGTNDDLGNGKVYTSGNGGSAVPVAVASTSGSGTLSGVKSLTSSMSNPEFCALLTSGGVDCWGLGGNGDLGNGKSSDSYGSAVPVAVVSTSGSGTLSGVTSLSSDGSGYCALLTSGKVDCWGYGNYGDLGNGKIYTSGNAGSAVPVTVVSTSGSGTLSGVTSLASGDGGYCALLTSGNVDCWGSGGSGELGNGQFNDSAVPVAVVSTSGSGTLSGGKSLTSDSNGYCALLTSGKVDCWGDGSVGELGNGQFYTTGNEGSAVPVAVVSASGSGTLSGVSSLTATPLTQGSPEVGYCALLTSGGVDCWGAGGNGQLGNGKFYRSGNQASAVPVAVVSTSGSGTLSGVTNVKNDGNDGYCALLTSGGVDCWGNGFSGDLGNGQFNDSAVPVAVI